MATFTDEEFGLVTLRRSARASQVRIRVGTDGLLQASLPLRAPVSLVARLIESSRSELRLILAQHHKGSIYKDGMSVGKSHRLVRRSGSKMAASLHGQQIILTLANDVDVESAGAQAVIRPVVITALRKEAKKYLPRRLSFLAQKFGFSYRNVRFSHAAGRWGSCTSKGTISLNIALMKLPFELIDYVLLHELCHTAEMNHSPAFWSLVSRCDPLYESHRRALKQQTPSI